MNLPGGYAEVPSFSTKAETFLDSILYIQEMSGRKMSNSTENSKDQLANGQVSCDLRGNSDAAKSETQLD